jgi:hypothetical protein
LIAEALDRRIFGAVELIDDLSGDRIAAPLKVSAPGLTLLHNRLGLWVIREVPGQDDYTRAFDDPPARPPRSDFRVEVQDPGGRFLPRAMLLPLPRWLPTPQDAPDDPVAAADDARRPVELRLYPASAAVLRPGWSVLRLRLHVTDLPAIGLANVLVEATPPAALALPLRRTLTDHHGEALIAIPGVPALMPGDGGLTADFELALSFVLDPAIVARSDATSFAIPDPDQVLSRLAAGAPGVERRAGPSPTLTAGRSRRHVQPVPWS